MKKIILVMVCAVCFSVNMLAQPPVRIGNMEIIIRKQEQDTTMQVNILDSSEKKSSDNNQEQSKTGVNKKTYYQSIGYWGLGFILPKGINDCYETTPGNSFNLDFGKIHRYQLTQRLAVGWTFNYSFYRYRIRGNDDTYEPDYIKVITGKEFEKYDIYKQIYRTHNLAAGPFVRFYFVAPKYRGNDGVYLDLGIQGDFAFSKKYKIKTYDYGKNKYRHDYAFEPFTASAIARIGWKANRGLGSISVDDWNWKPFDKSRAIFVRYRFTDAFNQKALPMDIPPFTVGILFF